MAAPTTSAPTTHSVPRVQKDGGYFILLEHVKDQEFPVNPVTNSAAHMSFEPTFIVGTPEQKSYWLTIPELQDAFKAYESSGKEAAHTILGTNFASLETDTGDLFHISSIQVTDAGLLLVWPLVEKDPNLVFVSSDDLVAELEETVRRSKRQANLETRRREAMEKTNKQLAKIVNQVKVVVNKIDQIRN